MIYAELKQIKTSRLLLRKLTMADLPQYYSRLGSSQKVTEHMLWQPHKEISESAASLEKVLKRYSNGNCYRWGIERQEDHALIGMIELLRFEEESGVCSFAYMLGEDFWDQGYGTEAVEAAFGFAFSELKVSAIIADHFTENPASGAVMRKVGMQYIRTIPDKYIKNGKTHDAAEYGITRDIWNKKPRC